MRVRAAIVAIVMCSGTIVPATSVDASHAVTKDRIRIGLHMPFTGAVPIPSESAQKGSDVYWRWLEQRGVEIKGRDVRVIVKNDNYNPSQAVAVCKEMVEKNHVFLLAGIMQPSGADQIQACARYAASVGVPYLSFGSTEVGLNNLPMYFAMTSSWKRQARKLADLLVSDLRARRERNGMLRFDTPNYQDTHEAFVRRMSKKNAALDYDRGVSHTSGQAQAQTVVAEMKTANIDNVFILSSPVWFLQVLQAAENQDYRPMWVGIDGMPLSGDTLASVGCRQGNLGRSRFLSPLPAYASRDSFDQRHDRAMRKVYDGAGDSMTWLGWAGAKAVRKLLEKAGRDLSRKRFVEKAERARSVRTGILPRFGFTRNDHMGGRGTHLLKVDCRERRWTTLRRFVTDF